jgi:TetR/AcrR family transcriptional repressor of mexJK operon
MGEIAVKTTMSISETSRGTTHPAPATGSRGDLRREAILKAATELFLEKGYGGTSIGAVNRRAGGSRTSIYQYFGSKEALFGAIVAQKCGEILMVLAEPDVAQRPPREALTRFGYRFLEIVLGTEGIALTRAVIADSARFPELAVVFHEAGPVAGKARLARYLADQSARGALRIADPARSARQLADMMIGTLQMRALLGVTPPDEAERMRVVDEAVETFLKATAA